MNSTSGTLATLRRLYHHLLNGGTFNMVLDTATLSRAISTIEELSEGACRFNCRTAKENWKTGYRYAYAKVGIETADNTDAEEAYQEWKTKYTLESEIGFIKETPHEL